VQVSNFFEIADPKEHDLLCTFLLVFEYMLNMPFDEVVELARVEYPLIHSFMIRRKRKEVEDVEMAELLDSKPNSRPDFPDSPISEKKNKKPRTARSLF